MQTSQIAYSLSGLYCLNDIKKLPAKKYSLLHTGNNARGKNIEQMQVSLMDHKIFKEFINHIELLQGRYEAERLPKDFSPDRIVLDFAFNILNPLGFLYRPVVDEDYLANGGQKPTWPDGKPFAACLIHDMDAVSLYSLKQSLRLRKA